MERDQVLAFRLARHGLAERGARSLAEAAACPASDFVRGAALLALVARSAQVSRAAYDQATDSGELVLAPSLRAAIHALAPADFALYGQGLVASDDGELIEQLGQQLKRELGGAGIAPSEALAEVAAATTATLAGGQALTKDELHAELRSRVRDELLPWCRGCGSHHVAPMLWRFAGVQAGMRCDSKRRYLLGEPSTPPPPVEAARRFLRFYGPATAKELAAWTGVARTHARRLWGELEDELAEVRLDGRRTWVLREDDPELASPPAARGVRLVPPRDPYLQQADRATLAPDPDLRKRLFRPVASPGGVLQEGRLAGMWRARARGKRTEIEVEELEPIDRDELESEAERVAAARGSEAAEVVWS
jgi:hypothetical protein